MGSRPLPPLQRLVVSLRGDPLLELPLEASCLGIGCAEDNDLRLSGHGVHKHHLVLRRRGRRWMALAREEALIEDRSGRSVRQILVEPGARVRFGEYVLEVTEGDPTASSGTATLDESVPCRESSHLALLIPGSSGRRHVRIGPRGATIGRGGECDIVLPDSFMSRWE